MEASTVESVPRIRMRTPLDRALAVIAAVLMLAVVGTGTYLVYSVFETRALEQGATPRARLIAELHQQMQESPNDASLRVRLGEAYAADGRLREAVRELNTAIELNPEHTGAYLVLGLVAMIERDYDSANGYFMKVIELTEGQEFENLKLNRQMAFYYLGESALDTSRYEEAIGYFKAVIRMNRGSADAYFGLGLALMGIEDYVAARDNFEIALAFDPKFAQAHYEMAQTYLAEDDRINAAVHFAQAALLAPDNELPAEALASLGTVEEWEARAREALAAQDMDAALEAALITRGLDPQDPSHMLLHGQVLEAMGENEVALEVYTEALEIAPGDPEIAEAVARLSGE